MPDIHNRKLMIPRLPGSPRTFRRGTILDGTIKVLYGPGHWPDAGFRPGTLYEPPDDWIPAGYLLRRPQVVMLSAFFPEAFDREATYAENGVFYRIGHSADPRATGAGFFQGPEEDEETWIYAYNIPDTVTNGARRYLDEFRDIFDEVKERIESVRQGRTWVERVEVADERYLDPFFPNRFHNVTLPSGDFGTEWFGTNFLHISVGHHYRDYSPTVEQDPSHLTIYISPDSPFWDNPSAFPSIESQAAVANISAEALDDDPLYTGVRDRLRETWGIFGGYRVMLWSYADYWLDSDTPARPAGTLMRRTNSEGTTFDDFVEDPDVIIWNSEAFALQDQIIGANAGQLYGAMAEALNEDIETHFELDETPEIVTHEGSCLGLTADEIVGKIAEHFGFDPTTGADLG